MIAANDFERISQHGLDHIGDAQGFPGGVCERNGRGAERRRVEVQRPRRIGSRRRIGQPAGELPRQRIDRA